jgi:multiple sugar transport system permease protein
MASETAVGVTTTRVAKRSRWVLTPAKREAIEGYVFIFPWLIGFVVFLAGPLLASFYFSFTEYELARPPVFIGLKNYVKLVDDPLFYQSLKVTAIYTFFSVPLGITLSFLVALLLNQKVKLLGFFRTMYYMPALVPAVASAMLWIWLLNPEFGLVNALLKQLFGIKGPPWLGNTRWALPSLIIMSLWGVGGPMLIYLAGLQGVPTEMYEAARIDGANAWKCFRYITIPQMTPVIFYNLVSGIIGSFQVFSAGYLMTGGGPGHATLFYVLYLYDNAFRWFKMGYASALAWVLFVIIMVLTVITIRSSSAWVYYSGELRGKR